MAPHAIHAKPHDQGDTVRWSLCLVAAAGCSDDPRPAFEVCNLCVADRDTRCMLLDNCEHDRDCPTGTTCRSKRCGVVASRAEVDEDLLRGQFGVGSMFVETMNSDAELHWVKPNDSVKEVTCALYRCIPEVVRRGQRGGGDLAGDGLVIDNYEKCVYAESGRGTSADGVYKPLDINRSRAPSNVTNDPSCPRGLGRVPDIGLVIDLAFACMAFDSYDLVAVSPYIRIDPAALAGKLSSIPKDAICARDFDPCYEPLPANRFGTCHGHTCRARCLTDEDCTAPERCERQQPTESGPISSRLVGVCVAPPTSAVAGVRSMP